MYRPNTTLKWKLNSETSKFEKSKTRSLIQEAFNDWAKYTPLQFRQANAGENAEFNINFFCR